MSDRLHVVMATEGTYPFHGGGVSTWCDSLLTQLHEIDFTVLPVTMNPYLKAKYRLPANVKSMVKVPLWGIEEPAEYAADAPFSSLLRRRWETTEGVIAERFLPAFERFLRLALGKPSHVQGLATTIGELHAFFLDYDYHYAMRTPEASRVFEQAIAAVRRDDGLAGGAPSYGELAEALGLLYRFLLVLNVPVPRGDIYHSSAAGFCGLPCVVGKLRTGAPYLLTEHGVYLREQFLGLRRHVKSAFVRAVLYRLTEAVARVNYALADQVSPVCRYNARWERWFGVPESRIRVIYNGTDPQRFTLRTHRIPGPPRVMSMGLIFPLKGQLDLIEAAALVRQQMPDVEFGFYGSASDEGYYAECLTRIKDLQLGETVKFHGLTSDPASVYQQADVVAMPSVSEAFPYALIEAMLCGAAVAATDVGGVREALGDTGVLVTPRRPAEMAAALVKMLKAPEVCARMGLAARERALEHFTLAKIMGEYRDAYAGLRRRPTALKGAA